MTDELRERLREAKKHFEAGPRYRRLGAILALQAVIAQMREASPAVDAELLHWPLVELTMAMDDLNRGVVDPMLAPIRSQRGGRKPRSIRRGFSEAVLVAIADRLHINGLSVTAADQQIALEAKKFGMREKRGRGPITPTTIRGWRKQFREHQRDEIDVGLYREVTEGTASMSTREASTLLQPWAGMLREPEEPNPSPEKK